MSKNNPYWGNRLAELMDLQDISPSELARRLGVTPTTISLWQRKQYPTLSAKKAAELCEVFNVPWYKIFPLVEDASEEGEQ